MRKSTALYEQAGAARLLGLFGLCVYRFWITPLASSFRVDEAVTAFVVRFGAGHASLRVAPQVPQSIYYALPSLMDRWFGFSEVWHRVPSILAAAGAALVMAWIARRLIHPQAGWFAALGCFAMSGINAEAVDARPYALGMLVAALCVVFLIRWLDEARVADAALFILFAALLWRTHLVYWPFYSVLPLYAGTRLLKKETPARWRDVAFVFAVLGLALIPVALRALELMRGAAAHVIVPPPTLRNLVYALKFGFVVACLPVVWLLCRACKWPRTILPASSAMLLLGWWLIHPVTLFIYSRLSGNSVFVSRYLSLLLPGAVLGTTFLVSRYVPGRHWKSVTLALGLGLLLFQADWKGACPLIHQSDWRGAAASLSELGDSRIPVICPSPFIEAKPPVWNPGYVRPGFLYAHLSVYPVPGRTLLFPFEPGPEAERYASELIAGPIGPAQRFAIYGSTKSARDWRHWFAARLPGWTARSLGPFGDVDVVLFERPDAIIARM
ncbi:MAG: hypothetical protein LLG20_07620 [Acidobacteriales bacterium]|nr:hypothetical protein [Terriglobales bacterium]